MLTTIAATFTMWTSIAVVVVAIGLYMTDRVPMELVSAGIVTALLILFAFPFAVGANGERVAPETLLKGFGNGALITIMALLVLGQGLFQTGALDGPSRRLLKAYDVRPRTTLIGVFGAAFVFSAFINDTPVVVMFLPIVGVIASRMNSAPSKLMMPLSFTALLGGMTTLIGSSTNLLAAETFARLSGRELGFFELTPIGLILASVGLIYILIASPFLLPNRDPEGQARAASAAAGSGKQFIAQIEITPNHPMVGLQAVAGMFPDLPNLTVRMVQRGEDTLLPPFDEVTLCPGDLLIIAATRQALTDTLAQRPRLLRSIWLANVDVGADETARAPNLSLTEAVISPGSRLISRTIDQIGFSRQNDIVVLGVQRRSRMIRARLGEIRLEAGDTLLLCGTTESLDAMRSDRDLLLLDWSRTDLPDMQKAVYARVIALTVIISAATGFISILHAALLGAVLMIATGCLNTRQAARALNLQIFMLIGAALAMGAALEATGAADFIAQHVVAIAAPFGPTAILSMMFITVALTTNILSNNATAIIFTPIAVSTARQLGVDPTLFVMCVIYAANCAFATPIAYQTNLLVMGPGHYRFADYIKFGTPLVLLNWTTFTIYVAWRYAHTGG